MHNKPKISWKSWQSLAQMIQLHRKLFPHTKLSKRKKKKKRFLASHEILYSVFRQSLWVAVESVKSQWTCQLYIIFAIWYQPSSRRLLDRYIQVSFATLPSPFPMKSYWTKSGLAFTCHYYQQCCATLLRLFYCTKYPLFSKYTYLLPFFYSNNMCNFSSSPKSLSSTSNYLNSGFKYLSPLEKYHE